MGIINVRCGGRKNNENPEIANGWLLNTLTFYTQSRLIAMARNPYASVRRNALVQTGGRLFYSFLIYI